MSWDMTGDQPLGRGYGCDRPHLTDADQAVLDAADAWFDNDGHYYLVRHYYLARYELAAAVRARKAAQQ